MSAEIKDRPELSGAVDIVLDAFAAEGLTHDDDRVRMDADLRALLLDLAGVLRVAGVSVSTPDVTRENYSRDEWFGQEVKLWASVRRAGPVKRVCVIASVGALHLRIDGQPGPDAPALAWHPANKRFVGPRVIEKGQAVRDWTAPGAPFVRREPVELLLEWVLPHLVKP